MRAIALLLVLIAGAAAAAAPIPIPSEKPTLWVTPDSAIERDAYGRIWAKADAVTTVCGDPVCEIRMPGTPKRRTSLSMLAHRVGLGHVPPSDWLRQVDLPARYFWDPETRTLTPAK